MYWVLNIQHYMTFLYVFFVCTQVYNLLVPSSVECGAPYESLHVIPRAYPEGIAGVSFCDDNVLVTGSKDHQVSMCVSVCLSVCVYYVYMCVHMCL